MTEREIDEYRALRATIRERGTTRVWVFIVGIAVWAGLAVATAALAALPVATLLPLLILAAAFEAVLAIHTGVERIGRYIQVFFEDSAGDPGWEHRVMVYGRMFPGAGSDPVFTAYFLTATVFNFVPVLLAGAVPIEYGVVGAIHALFIVRLLLSKNHAAHQRDGDLERFQKIRSDENSKS
ncbi:MAG TPA: hypothetical protein VHZ73_05060 [Vicinamibacterales bacterium]|jgi:hypothetical protein|nr:hypothetical protein [Vicinamibacterales bacterium]